MISLRRLLIAVGMILPVAAFCVSSSVAQNLAQIPSGVQVAVPPAGESKKPGNDKPAGEKNDKPADEKKDEKEKSESKGDKGEKPDKSSEPIKRPSQPDDEPDPEQLKLRPDEEGKVRFNFTGQPWPGVLEWLADVSEMSLDWQELPGDYLNLITQRGYTLPEARDLINSHLLARGYTMLRHGEVLSVIKIEKLNPGMVPRVAPRQLAERMPYEFVKVSFELDWLMASEAVEELKPMLSPNGKLTALKATNRIEAMDAVLNLSQIHDLLQQEQSDTSQDALIREFHLEHSLAEDVVEQLHALLGIEKKGASKGPMTPQQMEQMKREAAMKAQQQKGGKAPPSKPKPKIYLIANRRQNIILANAPPDKMAIIDQAIRALDVPSGHEHSLLRNLDRMQVYRLETVDPKALIETLEDLGRLDFDTRLEVDEKNRAIIAYASLADHITINSLVRKLDRGGRRSQVIPLPELKAEMVAKKIDFMMGGGRKEEAKETPSRGESRFFNPFFSSGGSSPSRSRSRSEDRRADSFRVDADTKNNALVLWCNDFELAKVESLLEQLRAMPKREGDLRTPKLYRLATLDPEPLVETLVEMDVLGIHASLRADTENNAVLVVGTEEDHQKICELIERLDGSEREFKVMRLRRLPADYVAGTIKLMMSTGKGDQPVLDRYAYRPYTSRRKPEATEDTGGFRVEADVENNRLLLLANEVELEMVTNLLIELGEIPPEEGDPSTVRVIDALPDEDMQQLLDQIHRAWPSVAPNPLILPETKEPEEDQQEEAEQQKTVDAMPDCEGQGRVAQRRFSGPQVRFAQLETSSTAPAAEARDGSREQADPPPAAVTIIRRDDGRLVLSSEDTRALDQLEELLAKLAPPRSNYKIFRLNYAWAFSVALTLEDIFEEDDKDKSGQSRSFWSYYYGNDNDSGDDSLLLSKRRPIKFIYDNDSNSVLVKNADPAQLKRVEDLIEFYDQPEPTDSQSVRKTKIITIRYSTASVIAEAVKDVFRDLLSANDKALVSGPQKATPERSYTYVFDSSEGGEQRKAPSFKGLLSLGVDDSSNTLIVSAPAYFIDDILLLVEKLDMAAEPTAERVEVVQVGDAISAEHVRRALATILRQGGAKADPPKDAPPKPPGPNGHPGG